MITITESLEDLLESSVKQVPGTASGNSAKSRDRWSPRILLISPRLLPLPEVTMGISHVMVGSLQVILYASFPFI